MPLNVAEHIAKIRRALNEIGAHGEGWWYNAARKALVSIDSSDLGPHGDHDGWIALDEYAKQLGLDPKMCKLFRIAQFGIDASELPPDMKKARDGWFDMGDEGFDEWFYRAFGITADEARDYPNSKAFDKIVRVRRWPSDGYTVFFCCGDVSRREILWCRDILDKVYDPSRDGADPRVMLEGTIDGSYASSYLKVMGTLNPDDL